jgi:hypothetical protein
MPIDITSEGLTEAVVKVNALAARLEDLRPEMDMAIDELYSATREWMDSEGEGSWSSLAPSTVKSKMTRGLSDPSKPLYAYGDLFESATSPDGPYSYRHDVPGGAVIGVDWAVGQWQIPYVLAYGAGAGGKSPQGAHPADWHIPARPIWPQGTIIESLRAKIALVILRGERP